MKSDPRFDDYHSYIMSAYVDFIQAAGARIVPLILDEDDETTKDKLSKLNGVLYPGGGGGYFYHGQDIFN